MIGGLSVKALVPRAPGGLGYINFESDAFGMVPWEALLQKQAATAILALGRGGSNALCIPSVFDI